MSTLYIVATPIGNLEDITMRALRILSEVDFILCEDTRVTQRLLEHYKIRTKTISYHQHSDLKKTEQILGMLSEGKNLALVSDAGTPGISDPGGKLVQAAIDRFGIGHAEGDRFKGETQPGGSTLDVAIESVPGPSAVTAALSISGIPTDKFVFLGFPPHKKGRQTFLHRIVESEVPVVVYESKHRIIKFLVELLHIDLLTRDKQNIAEEDDIPGLEQMRWKKKSTEEKKKKIVLTSVVVCREISKMHETVYRGELKNIIEQIKSAPEHQKGEFTVIIGK
jgi:16S rRNA (cytidine1402-2'-O)-methyltransferase